MMDERGPNLIQVKVRMSKNLHRKLTRDAARRQGQTTNAEIVRRLEASFEIEGMLRSMSSRIDVIYNLLAEQKERASLAERKERARADAPLMYAGPNTTVTTTANSVEPKTVSTIRGDNDE
jgi:hypothetical protein